MKTKLFLIIISFLIQIKVYAQENLIVDKSIIDSNTKLICRNFPPDDDTYKNFNFIVENPVQIKRIISKLTLGENLTGNVLENPSIRISIIQNYKEIKFFYVNPTFETILINNKIYNFKIKKLKKISRNHHFNYKIEKIIFKNKEHYNEYLTTQKNDPTFLFDYSPQFKFEGSFNLQFKKSKTFNRVEDISRYILSVIEKHATRNEFDVTYTLIGINKTDPNQFTFEIKCSKELYEKLEFENLKKEEWKTITEQGVFFYKLN
ncbi:MAG: hypothetical protein V4667_02385 [Bacteroidota bacterium]